METLQHVNLRYELLLTRFQGIKPSNNHKNNYFLELLNCISRGGDAAVVSPLPTEADNGHVASIATAYEQECRRVALFYRSQHQQLWNSLLDVVSVLRSQADNPTLTVTPGLKAAETHTSKKLKNIRASLDGLGAKTLALDAFTKANIEAIAELALLGDGKKKFSTNISGEGSFSTLSSTYACITEEMQKNTREYSAAAEAVMLGVLCLDPLILGLSDAYALLRLVEKDTNGAATGNTATTTTGKASSLSSSCWVAPQKFKRTTRKFWIKLTDITFFKTEVIKHLPILVYGNRRKIIEIDPSDLPFTFPTASESDSSPISSVYLDSLPAGLPAYHSRLRRQDGATVVRLRWYGKRNPDDSLQQIFVEKKVHVVGDNSSDNNVVQEEESEDGKQKQQSGRREGQSGSEKQRVALPQSEIPALLSGHPVAVPKSFSQEDFDFLQQVQSYIIEGAHVPVLRTCYNRTAFQHDSHNRVRISMDTNLHMVRDYIPIQTQSSGGISGGGQLQQWCRSDNDIANANAMDTVYFPYAVIEVKLQVNPPQWLQNLVRQKILLPVPKFSKFLHGTALLYQPYVENVPYWFLPAPLPSLPSSINSSTSDNSTLSSHHDHRHQQQQHSDYLMTPATWEMMIEPSAEAVSDAALWLFPTAGGSDADRSRKEEDALRATQEKHGLLWGRRRTWRRGQQGQQHQPQVVAAAGDKSSSTTTITTPSTISTTLNGTTGATCTDAAATEEKYEAPGTPDGASPRSDVAPNTHTALQNQALMDTMMKTGTSNATGGILMTSNVMSGSGSGQRCPYSSSPISSASVSSLVSSAEGAAAAAHGHGTASNYVVFVEQEQVQQQSSSSWQVFQEPALPLPAVVASPAAGGAADAAGKFVVSSTEADLESGFDGNNGVPVITSNGSQNTSPTVAAAAATGADTTKPVSRKSSLIHLVSSIPGLGGISRNNTYNTSSNTTSAPGEEEEEKKKGLSVFPFLTAAAAAAEEEKEKGKKDSAILPSYSIISSPSLVNPSGGLLSRGGAGGGGAPPRAMVRTRVEPKTFFANERTFLQWLQISVLVMFLGLNLLNGSMLLPGSGTSTSSSSSGICASNDSKCIASKISGALIAPVALLFMAYALFMYRHRTRQILRRESVRYDDQRGPAILVAILLTVMLISYVIAMIYVF